MSDWKPITTLEELQKLCAELDAIRPKTMTEGEVMRLCSFAWKEGEKWASRRAESETVARIVAWLRADGEPEGDSYADAIERGEWKKP